MTSPKTRLARFAAFIALVCAGCSGPSAKVTGKVTCSAKPVQGSLLFSPIADGVGPAVSAAINPDGTYSVELKAVGKYRIVVTPSDVVYPAKPGKEYPCALTPLERDINAGDSEIVIDLGARPK